MFFYTLRYRSQGIEGWIIGEGVGLGLVRNLSLLGMCIESVRFCAEACGVPAGAYSVYGPPGDARIPPKDGALG